MDDQEQTLLEDFREALTRETLRGERAQVLIMGAIYLVMLGLAVAYDQVLRDQLRMIDIDPPRMLLIIIFLGAAATYQLIVWLLSTLIFRRRPHTGLRLSYINTLIEIAIPTGAVIGAFFMFGLPDIPLFPVGFLYALLVIMKIARLDGWLCFFAGLVAVGAYITLAAVMIQFDVFHLAMAVTLLITGMLTGVIAAQIKRRVLHAFTGLDHRKEGQNRFGEYISPQMARRLIAHEPLDVSRKKRQVAMMMLHVPDFATFAAVREQADLIAFTDKLLGLLVDAVSANHGAVVKAVGGAFLVAFDEVFGSGEPAKNAVAAAHTLISRVNSRIASGELPATAIQIGVHSAQTTTGTRKGRYQIDGPLITQTVAITSLNQKVGSQLLISDDVWEVVSDHYAGIQISPLHDEQTGQNIGLHRLV